MNKEKVFQSILNGTAILITGSGAHCGALNAEGSPFPSGTELAKEIYGFCGIDTPENPWDLQDASDTYVEMYSEKKLINILEQILYVGAVTEAQKELYSFNWQRVYTTNYDNVPKLATNQSTNTLLPITLGMSRNEKILEENLCIYINGYIGRLNENTLNGEFKLTGRSYLAADAIEESEWGAVFSDDIITADCIVIVGLSLDYDLEIKRFLYNTGVIEKTIFVEKSDISKDKIRKMERLGTVFPVGMDAFVEELLEYSKTYEGNKKDRELLQLY